MINDNCFCTTSYQFIVYTTRYIIVIKTPLSGFIPIVLFCGVTNKLVSDTINIRKRRLGIDSVGLGKTAKVRACSSYAHRSVVPVQNKERKHIIESLKLNNIQGSYQDVNQLNSQHCE